MLMVISPAKTLDFESTPETKKHSSPQYLDKSGVLIELLRKQSPSSLSKLMGISPKLAEINAERYQNWRSPFTLDNAKQALFAFKGDVYIGLAAESYNARDIAFAQKHLRILSGLYGLLKPLDLIQAYRLEMGTKLENPGGKDLYAFWGSEITRAINDALVGHRSKVLVNLASQEYFGSIKPAALDGRLVTPVFKDFNNGNYKVLGFFAKKARGLMASYIVKNRIDKADDIKSFDMDGYRFNSDLTRNDEWVFTRKAS